MQILWGVGFRFEWDETDDDGSGRMTWRALSEQYNRYPDPLHGSRRLFPTAHYYPLYLSRLVAVEVSNNGQDWTDSGITYLYQADSIVTTIFPGMGMDMSGTPLFVVGRNFRCFRFMRVALDCLLVRLREMCMYWAIHLVMFLIR